MTETEIEDENILGHIQKAVQRVEVFEESKLETCVEYACLRSMMLEPKNTTMWNALALVYMISDRTQDAEETIERSLDINTSNSWTWAIWGDVFKQEGRVVQSERAYRMAVELDPENRHALRQLVFICERRGAHPEALSLLEMLLPVMPEDQDLWDIYSECLQRQKN